MRISSRAGWLPAALAGAAAASSSSGVVEVDLVFPRNDSYAPTPILPVIFAIQSPELAPFIAPHISLTIREWNNTNNVVVSDQFDLRWANLSGDDAHLVHRGYTGFNTEGSWWITWIVGRQSCTDESLSSPYAGNRITTNNTSWSVLFTTKKSAHEVDLVAATNDNKTCPEDIGVAINVTDTLKIPGSASAEWDGGGDRCAVVASSTPTPDPCRVKISSAAASSISSAATARVCDGRDPPVSCPSKDKTGESSAPQLAVAGAACLAATLGALGFTLM